MSGVPVAAAVTTLLVVLGLAVALASNHWYSASGEDVGLLAMCTHTANSPVDPDGLLDYNMDVCVSLAETLGFYRYAHKISDEAAKATTAKIVDGMEQLWYCSLAALIALVFAVVGYAGQLAAAMFCASQQALDQPTASGFAAQRGALVGGLAAALNVAAVTVWFVGGRVTNNEVVASKVADLAWAAWLAAALPFLSIAASIALYRSGAEASMYSGASLLPLSSGPGTGGRYRTFGHFPDK
ncbi:uncharacterized protein AMSG_00189 [Thecamonas trahens ATCC 50062]|uniref:Uncharacterized protein n=1 Tax=Thecamonas trahens ATCC 50062 TaxID=461836 RepID=A0A0L0D1J2_THETB|nr:hypothetical protein AMSG_00189 [Thecamonas trahens ATCC 50062]KNC46071.1 hypothetical protein AMSG_00189 [Thecamonas trahens ATCC 50062]|eukprot:XP_013763051.1 hypothetical protein AMSG_00189 [Thecamonas trahens ATCC 50062]